MKTMYNIVSIILMIAISTFLKDVYFSRPHTPINLNDWLIILGGSITLLILAIPMLIRPIKKPSSLDIKTANNLSTGFLAAVSMSPQQLREYNSEYMNQSFSPSSFIDVPGVLVLGSITIILFVSLFLLFTPFSHIVTSTCLLVGLIFGILSISFFVENRKWVDIIRGAIFVGGFISLLMQSRGDLLEIFLTLPALFAVVLVLDFLDKKKSVNTE